MFEFLKRKPVMTFYKIRKELRFTNAEMKEKLGIPDDYDLESICSYFPDNWKVKVNPNKRNK